MIGLSNGPDVAKVSTVVSSAVYDSIIGLVLSRRLLLKDITVPICLLYFKKLLGIDFNPTFKTDIS